MTARPAPKIPKSMQALYEAIVSLTDEVCKRHLTDEYAELARELAAALARKRPSPLLSGKPATWACGVLYALGQVNFLFDKTQEPYMQAKELSALFGISNSTASARGSQIMRMLKIGPLDPRWWRPSQMADNPLVWMVETDSGFIVDARELPRALQEELAEAGLIPFVPSSSA